MNWFGLAHIVSLLYLTGVVAFVVGLQESPDDKNPVPHVLGCWGKMLGSLVGLGLIVYILSLFAN